MRRLVLILLLFVMPFQAGWAAAAGYCQHEATATNGWHFGHHEHRHQAGDDHEQIAKADPANKAGKVVIDNDCGVCHLASAQSAVAQQPQLPQRMRVEAAPLAEAPRFGSASTGTPDRPQWRRLG